MYFPVPWLWACYWFCLLPRAVGFCLVVLLVVPICGCWVWGFFSGFFFFFWINKNLFPKRAKPNKEYTRSQKRPKKTKNGQHLP